VNIAQRDLVADILSYPVPGMETDRLDADGITGSGTGLRRESSKCRRCGLSHEHYGA
ncbi:hypothetical protein B0H12DRAFT_1160640, partial [Mycena haematopus]